MPGRRQNGFRVDMLIEGQRQSLYLVLPMEYTKASFQLEHKTRRAALREAQRLAERANVKTIVAKRQFEFRNEIVCVKK